jgi:hypothetical protein
VLKRLKYPVLSAKKWKNGAIWCSLGETWGDLVKMAGFAKKRVWWRNLLKGARSGAIALI